MFIIGFLSGIMFMLLTGTLILVYMARRQNKEIESHLKEIEGVDDAEIKEIIKSKRNDFIKLENFGIGQNLKLIKNNSMGIIEEISKKYCPNAKYPIYEITLEEALLLNIHISERILKNLEDKKLEIFKKLKLSKILELNDFKNKIQNNPLYSKLEKYRFLNTISKGWMLINIANPKYWIKKILFDGTLEVASRTLGVIIINSIGSETHKIYSRKFKDKDVKNKITLQP